MRKASAITISIFVMMIVLAILLGYTAFYVDQILVRPVVLMEDSETSLRCFFVLSNMIGGEYLSEGETPDENTLRGKLFETYNVSNSQDVYLGSHQDEYEQSLQLMYAESDFTVRSEEVFRNAVIYENLLLACDMMVYGPVRTGTAGIFVQSQDEVKQAMDYWQEEIYGS